jgi:hypothetical protein
MGHSISTGPARVNEPSTPSHVRQPVLRQDNIPEPVREFFDYWNSLPKQGLIPRLDNYFDRAPPHLQPFVGIADVHSPTDIRLRLFGTGLVDLSGQDPTGKPMQHLYAEHVRGRMQDLVWSVATRPVGYLCVRSVATTGGRLFHNPSICLPIAVPMSAVKAVITYAYQDMSAVTFAPSERLDMIQDLRLISWIDLGAGVPGGEVTGAAVKP